MTTRIVKFRLNPQQRELLQRTVDGGAAASIADLVRLAIRESHAAELKGQTDDQE